MRPPGTCRFRHVAFASKRAWPPLARLAPSPQASEQCPSAPQAPAVIAPEASPANLPGAAPAKEAEPAAVAPKRRKTEAQPQLLALAGLCAQGPEEIIAELKRIKEIAKEKWGDLGVTVSASGARVVLKVRSASKARMVRRPLRAHGVTATTIVN